MNSSASMAALFLALSVAPSTAATGYQDDLFPLAELSEDQRQALYRAIVDTVAEVIDQGVFMDDHPVAMADIFWSMFSGVVLWEASKKIISADKDYLKSTLQTAFEIFERGIRKG